MTDSAQQRNATTVNDYMLKSAMVQFPEEMSFEPTIEEVGADNIDSGEEDDAKNLMKPSNF